MGFVARLAKPMRVFQMGGAYDLCQGVLQCGL